MVLAAVVIVAVVGIVSTLRAVATDGHRRVPARGR